MSAETDFRAIWRRQHIGGAPPEKAITAKADSVRKKIATKTLAVILLLAVTLAGLSVLFYYFRPRLISTVAGIALEFLSILLYILVSGNFLAFLSRRENRDNTVKQQLEQLLLIRTKQTFLQKQILAAYFILLSAGIFLAMYEYARLMTRPAFLLAYGGTFLWFAFNWWFVRPRAIRKAQFRLNHTIDQLTTLLQQLEAE